MRMRSEKSKEGTTPDFRKEEKRPIEARLAAYPDQYRCNYVSRVRDFNDRMRLIGLVLDGWMDGWRFDVANELNRGRAVFCALC